MTIDKVLDVLIVDDDDADALMISEALSTMQPPPVLHRVRDGQEALDYLQQSGDHPAHSALTWCCSISTCPA